MSTESAGACGITALPPQSNKKEESVNNNHWRELTAVEQSFWSFPKAPLSSKNEGRVRKAAPCAGSGPRGSRDSGLGAPSSKAPTAAGQMSVSGARLSWSTVQRPGMGQGHRSGGSHHSTDAMPGARACPTANLLSGPSLRRPSLSFARGLPAFGGRPRPRGRVESCPRVCLAGVGCGFILRVHRDLHQRWDSDGLCLTLAPACHGSTGSQTTVLAKSTSM